MIQIKLCLLNALLDLLTNEEQEKFLIHETTINKLSSFSVTVITIVTVIVTIIGLLIGKGK